MIYAYSEQDDNGNYQTADGTRYLVHFASRVHGKVRDCWKQYESDEAALEAMGLTAVPVEVPEEELLGEQAE